MKRLITQLLLFLYMATCYAQLSKFEGTWIHKDIQMFIDIDGSQHPDAERKSFFRFDVNNMDVHIRHKMFYKFYDSGNELTDFSPCAELTSYFIIKNVEVQGDSIITCDIYSPPEMGKTYSGKTTPNNNMHYDELIEHSNYKFRISANTVLLVEKEPTIREFYSNNQLVDKDSDGSDDNYFFECYNEKDNW